MHIYKYIYTNILHIYIPTYIFKDKIFKDGNVKE